VKALVLGSTGVVGAALIRESLKDPRTTRVVAVSRRPVPQTHPRLVTAFHANFRDFSALHEILGETDVILCALGLSWYQASGEAQYREITHDYVTACARAADAANPAVRFCFVSGHGAGLGAAQAWARIKAETERDLEAISGRACTCSGPATSIRRWAASGATGATR
jgi:uncharacterized protein YbjT (DUF2867 family)